MDCKVGDKVGLKSAAGPAERGVIVQVGLTSDCVRIELESGKFVDIETSLIRNYSAAARKAWASQPQRDVGRPRGRIVDRVSVTLRLNRELWERFVRLESAGIIGDRTDWVNLALLNAVSALEAEARV